MERFNFKVSDRGTKLLLFSLLRAHRHFRAVKAAPATPGVSRLGRRVALGPFETRQLRRSAADGLRPLARATTSTNAPPNGAVTLWCDEERSPQDTWYDIEDLWLRLARQSSIRAEVVGAAWCLVVAGLRPAAHEEIAHLRAVALNATTYRWQLDGQRGNFVRSIAIEGDDLVLTVTSILTITRWPQGDDLGWQVKEFFAWLRGRRDEAPAHRSSF